MQRQGQDQDQDQGQDQDKDKGQDQEREREHGIPETERHAFSRHFHETERHAMEPVRAVDLLAPAVRQGDGRGREAPPVRMPVKVLSRLARFRPNGRTIRLRPRRQHWRRA